MPRRCSVCDHPDRERINSALVAGDKLRNIAQRFATSEFALCRHKRDHLPDTLTKAQGVKEAAQAAALVEQRRDQEAQEVSHADDLMVELQRCMRRVNLLFDACHEWLQDPDDPERYTLEPRDNEVNVVVRTTDAEGKPRTVRRKLRELLAEVETGRYTVERAEYKHADPRELVLKTAERLQGHLQLLAMLIGKLQSAPTINVLMAPEWVQVRGVLLDALAPFPEARVAVASRLAGVENGNHARY
jgi:hypothetical protein